MSGVRVLLRMIRSAVSLSTPFSNTLIGGIRRPSSQIEIASALNVKQPSVSKIEKQADMYLSTLRSYVEAVGGQLDLIARPD